MVILKSTELSQKMIGYNSAAEKFDKKIEKLNSKNKSLQQKIWNNIKKKEDAIDKIEKIIKQLEGYMNSEEVQDEVSTLKAIMKTFKNDISNYNKLNYEEIVPIGDILSKSGIEGINQAIKALQ